MLAIESAMCHQLRNLYLEADGLSATTGTFELSAVGADTWLDAIVSVWVVWRSAVTEVLDRLTNTLAATEQDGVSTLRGAEGKLIKGQALSTSLDDSSSSSLGEAKGSNLKSWDFQQARIISNSTNNDSSLVFLAIHVAGQARDGDWSVVDSGHADSLHNGVGELGLSTSADETVKDRKSISNYSNNNFAWKVEKGKKREKNWQYVDIVVFISFG
jgi:hypothetical protein